MRFVEATELHVPTPCVPARGRRVFVIISFVGLALLIGFDWLVRHRWWGSRALALNWDTVGVVLLLCLIGAWELRLRREHLPPHGQAPWCLGAAVGVMLFAAALEYVMPQVIRFLIQVAPSVEVAEGTIRIQRKAGGGMDDGRVDVGFVERRHHPAGWGFFTMGHAWQEFRLVPKAGQQRPSWSIRDDSANLVADDPEWKEPWNASGLMNAISRMNGVEFTPVERAVLSPALDSSCMRWTGGGWFQAACPPRSGVSMITLRVSGGTQSSFSETGVLVVFRGCLLIIFGLALHFAARATMGQGEIRLRERRVA